MNEGFIMRRFFGAAALAAMVCFGATGANAACQRLGFSVNDYGKEGPIRDAKKMLDEYIKKWAADRGITRYKVGKKDVSCELFLDVGVFDEHTCKASATFCWKGASNRPKKVSDKQ